MFCYTGHPHAIADVAGLQAALDGKAASDHTHEAGAHSHVIGDVTGLQGALDGKQVAGSYAAASHAHAIGDVTNLQAALDAKAPIAGPAHTGAVTTTGSYGFAAGAGGTVTQATSKSTGVTLNKVHGRVTMANSALAAATIVNHTLTNNQIAADDQVICSIVGGVTNGAAYAIAALPGNGSAVVSIRNNTAGSLSEAIQYRFTVIKGVNS